MKIANSLKVMTETLSALENQWHVLSCYLCKMIHHPSEVSAEIWHLSEPHSSEAMKLDELFQTGNSANLFTQSR